MTSQIEREAGKALAAIGLRLWLLDEMMSVDEGDDMAIRELRIKKNASGAEDYLVVVKGDLEGQRYVVFHAGTKPSEAIVGALNRIRSGEAKWKVDKPFGE